MPASQAASPARVTGSAKAANRRQIASQERRQAVLDAALDVFAARGFAEARLDDVAAAAGVAKGTIYLFCKDKEDLFEQVLLGAARPVLERLAMLEAAQAVMPASLLVGMLLETFRTEILGTKRRLILQLILTEGARFPRIAEFWHREVIAKGLPILSGLAQRACERGEMSSDVWARFPQLIVAPMLAAILWDRLFSAVAPLDVEGLLAAHHSLLFQSGPSGESRHE